MKLLNGLSRSEFLRTHWQKKPLLIRQAMANFASPVSINGLIKLATDESVESRLVLQDKANSDWQCEHGPFEESRFDSLPNSDWTLLVQGVEQQLVDVAKLLEQFDFIPNWRIDDVMISYAAPGGSVGPHLDNYDVFLLQGQGERHWHINETDYSEDDFIEGLELKVLNRFTAQQDWVLQAGDMLYLPPGVAHLGIARDDCITLSIGFRAPTDQELLIGFAEHLTVRQKPFFYSDPDLPLQRHSGEIAQQHIDYLHQLMFDRLVNDHQFALWFGQYITEPKQGWFEQRELAFDDFDIVFKQFDVLQRHGDVRISFMQQPEHIDLFIAGQHYRVDKQLLEFMHSLSQQHSLWYQELVSLPDYQSALQYLWQFFSAGWFYFADE